MDTRQAANEVAPGSSAPTRLRADAPLLDGYLSYLESDATPFITPGHKGRGSKLDADLGTETEELGV